MVYSLCVTKVTRAKAERTPLCHRLDAQRGLTPEGTWITSGTEFLSSRPPGLSDSWKTGCVTRRQRRVQQAGDSYHFCEHLKLQTLGRGLCLAMRTTAIGVCSLINMNAYCSWCLRIHNLCQRVAFVPGGSWGKCGRLKIASAWTTPLSLSIWGPVEASFLQARKQAGNKQAPVERQ